jgi:hypothetical protein
VRCRLIRSQFPPGSTFPRLAALEAAGAFAVSGDALPYTLQRALDRFAFGLDLVLDAIGARIARLG